MSARRHLKTTGLLVGLFTLIGSVFYCADRWPGQMALMAIMAALALIYWGTYRSFKDKRVDDDKASHRWRPGDE